MNTVTESTIREWAASDPYYLGRIPYLTAAAEIIARVQGETALEIGPYLDTQTLVPGCATMDAAASRFKPTVLHDVRKVPWPMKPERGYDLIVALQVWEHLHGNERLASAEAFRRARHVLMSFPYLWPGDPLMYDHAGLTRSVFAGWTLDRDPIMTLRVASDHPGLSSRCDRILYLFEGDRA